MIPRFSCVEPVSEAIWRSRITKIFAAGRFVRKKGFDYFLKAIPDVLASDGRIRFQIAGDGPEFDELKMLQTELKLEDKVQFLGFRNDVPLLMKESDLFVLPSLSEPFGIILLEAMATGTPIVTTRNHEALHLLNGDTAILLIKQVRARCRVEFWKRSTIQKVVLNVRKTHWSYSKTTTHPIQSYQKFCLYTKLWEKIG